MNNMAVSVFVVVEEGVVEFVVVAAVECVFDVVFEGVLDAAAVIVLGGVVVTVNPFELATVKVYVVVLTLGHATLESLVVNTVGTVERSYAVDSMDSGGAEVKKLTLGLILFRIIFLSLYR